jgi:three-Cys-motif partner protein
MPQKRFGSHDSTGRKLDVIATYLEMYQKALSRRTFETIYIDAFAGSGEIPIGETKSGLLDEDEEAKTVLVGSAVRAVAVDPPFSRYVFIDKREKCIRALRQRLEDNENFARIEFQGGDANALVQAFCGRGEWRSRRGVVLLDPFGSQVAWATVEAVAATRALGSVDIHVGDLGRLLRRQFSGSRHASPEAGSTPETSLVSGARV